MTTSNATSLTITVDQATPATVVVEQAGPTGPPGPQGQPGGTFALDSQAVADRIHAVGDVSYISKPTADGIGVLSRVADGTTSWVAIPGGGAPLKTVGAEVTS